MMKIKWWGIGIIIIVVALTLFLIFKYGLQDYDIFSGWRWDF